jgi:thioredoxin 1
MSDTTSPSTVQQFTDANFPSDVLLGNQAVLVDFYADWCPPCRLLAPVIESVAEQAGDQARVGKLNVDHNPEAARRYNISSLPTVLVFRHGEEVARLIGVQPAERYLAALRNGD